MDERRLARGLLSRIKRFAFALIEGASFADEGAAVHAAAVARDDLALAGWAIGDGGRQTAVEAAVHEVELADAVDELLIGDAEVVTKERPHRGARERQRIDAGLHVVGASGGVAFGARGGSLGIENETLLMKLPE